MNHVMRVIRWKWLFPIFLLFVAVVILLWLGNGELSETLGVAGYLFWSLAVLGGVRLMIWDQIFGSIGKSYHFHHLLGRVVGLLALGHTCLVLWDLKSLDSIDLAFDLSEPLFLSGWIGLALLFFPLVLSTIKQMKRSLWKRVHQVLILGLGAIAWHLYETGASVHFLVLVMILFGLVSLVTAIVNILLPGLLRKTLSYQVSDVRQLSPQVVEISFRGLGSKLTYKAGQFIYLSIECEKFCGVSQELHPFTLSSAPHEEKLRVAVRAMGDDSSCLVHLQSGNKATVEGPYGNLLNDVSILVPQLWIAGGIGVTPFISLLRTWSQEVDSKMNVDLVILVKKREDHVYAKELSSIAESVSGLRIHVWIDELDGVLTAEGLQKLIKNEKIESQTCVDQQQDLREVAISGSSEMVSHFREMVCALGIKTVRSEGFEFL